MEISTYLVEPLQFGHLGIVLISEMSLFQRENNMYLCKVGTLSNVLIKQGALISCVLLREVPMYIYIYIYTDILDIGMLWSGDITYTI